MNTAKSVWVVTSIPILVIVAYLTGSTMGAADWSRFRGPNGSGVADTAGLPIEFGPERNVVWKTPLPPGHSSPVLSENRIFLTAFEGEVLLTYCLDRRSGKILWRRQCPRPRAEKLDRRNSPASPTPATDGKNVYVFFADYGLISYDFKGHERWRLPLGPFNNVYGMAASPIVAQGKVLLICDQNVGSFMIAVGKDDGRVRWKIDRSEYKSGFSTPVLYQPKEGGTQLLVPGSFQLVAYSLGTGEKIWWVSGLSSQMKAVPVLSEDTVYIHGYSHDEAVIPTFEQVRAAYDVDGDGRFLPAEVRDERAKSWFKLMDLDGNGYLDADEWTFYRAVRGTSGGIRAIKLGGRGDMTEANVRWHSRKFSSELPSSLLYKKILYMLNDGGIVTLFEPVSGKVMAQGRLKGAVDKFYASPVAADDKIFMVSESGKVVVLKPDGSLDVLAVNDLDDLCYATPAIADGRIYIRTRGALYCFGLAEPPRTGG